MKFILEINLDNDAFQFNRDDGIKHCLTQVISKLTKGIPNYAIFDVNGNKVGFYGITIEDKE